MRGGDREDFDRARAAVDRARIMGVLVDALAKISMLSGHDTRVLRELSRTDPMTFSDDQVVEARRLAWRYRRQMPRHLAPRANPDDPIVREMEAMDG